MRNMRKNVNIFCAWCAKKLDGGWHPPQWKPRQSMAIVQTRPLQTAQVPGSWPSTVDSESRAGRQRQSGRSPGRLGKGRQDSRAAAQRELSSIALPAICLQPVGQSSAYWSDEP